MSSLTVSNAFFESTGNTRIQHLPTDTINVYVGGNPSFSVNSTSVSANSINGGSITGYRNKIINGGFDVWQRGTWNYFYGGWQYCADRWLVDFDGKESTGIEQDATLVYVWRETHCYTENTIPDSPLYYLRYYKAREGTGFTAATLSNVVEDVSTLSGETVTISFYSRSGWGSSLIQSISAIQEFGKDGSLPVETQFTGASNISVTGEWQKFSYTVTIPSVYGKTIGTNNHLRFQFLLSNATSFFIDFANVQVELGTIATPFEARPHYIDEELCLRYYQQYDYQPPLRGVIATSGAVIGTAYRIGTQLPVEMRTTPIDNTPWYHMYDGASEVDLSPNFTFHKPHTIQWNQDGYPQTTNSANGRPAIIFTGRGTYDGRPTTLTAEYPYIKRDTSIVSGSNLILHYDFGDRRSNQGSVNSRNGRTVQDITGNGFNGTIFGTPTYSPSDGASIYISPNDYIDFNQYGISGSGSNVVATVETFVKLDPAYKNDSWKMLFGFYRWDVLYASKFGMGFNTSNGDAFGICQSPVSATIATNQAGGKAIVDPYYGVWKHFVYVMYSSPSVRNMSSYKIYVNTVSQTLGDTWGTAEVVGQKYFSSIGRINSWKMNLDYRGGFNMGIFRIYNRELTLAEIQQNFNAQKTRFGIV